MTRRAYGYRCNASEKIYLLNPSIAEVTDMYGVIMCHQPAARQLTATAGNTKPFLCRRTNVEAKKIPPFSTVLSVFYVRQHT